MKNIPQICHLIWTRSSSMSRLQVFTLVTFHNLNPDWKIILHLIKQQPSELAVNRYVPDYSGRDYFSMVSDMRFVEINEVDLAKEHIRKDKCGIQISDILRERMLYKYGGVYSDFDMLWLRPMLDFKNINCIGDSTDFEATVCYFKMTHDHHNNSNFVSEPESPYVLSIIEAQDNIKSPIGHQVFNTKLLNRLYPTYEDIQNKYPRVIAIDYKTFYPYSIFELWRLYRDDDLSLIDNEGVMGVHWFNGHRLSYEYTSRDSFDYQCSMTSILKREGLV